MITEIPVLRPLYDEREEQAVIRVLRSGWTGSGPEVEAFEREFAEYLQVEPWQVVATNSCTAALQLALMNVPNVQGGEVVVPALTFVSTALVIRNVGAEIVFGDVFSDSPHLNTMWLDGLAPPWNHHPELSQRLKAVIPVHFAGVPLTPPYITCGDHDVAVIEDCAHAVGARINNKHVGTDPRSLFSCFSFNAVKNIGAGDGGAVVCHDRWLSTRLRKQRWCGIDKDTYRRATGSYVWDYVIDTDGFKFQMSEVNAAIARVQLAKIDQLNGRRREVAQQYREAFAELPWLSLPEAETDNVRHSNHLFIVRVATRERFMAHLKAHHIATGVHYKPVNLHPAYRGLPNPTPAAHKLWPTLTSLPMHAALSDADVARVITAVRSFA